MLLNIRGGGQYLLMLPSPPSDGTLIFFSQGQTGDVIIALQFIPEAIMGVDQSQQDPDAHFVCLVQLDGVVVRFFNMVQVQTTFLLSAPFHHRISFRKFSGAAPMRISRFFM